MTPKQFDEMAQRYPDPKEFRTMLSARIRIKPEATMSYADLKLIHESNTIAEDTIRVIDKTEEAGDRINNLTTVTKQIGKQLKVFTGQLKSVEALWADYAKKNNLDDTGLNITDAQQN